MTSRNPKNEETHHVILDRITIKVLRDCRGLQMRIGIRSEWVFCKEDGTRLVTIQRPWRTACKRADLINKDGKPTLKFHDLRHTFASRHVMAGTPLYTVSQLLNHKDPTVVKRYAHLSPTYRKEIAEKNAVLAAGWYRE